MSILSVNLSKIPYPDVKNAKIVGEFHNYLINNGALSVAHRGLRTENVNSCTAGALFGNGKNFLFHAAPELQPLHNIKNELEKFVEKLRQNGEEIKGFICGGWALDNNDMETVKSFDLYNTIANALDDLGVKFTMICGKEKNAPMDNIYATGNNLTMWNSDFKKILENKYLSKDEIIEALEQNYEFVESNAGQELKVIDKFM